MHLADTGDAGGCEGALTDYRAVVVRLDVDDDVASRQRVLHGGLDGVGGGVACPTARRRARRRSRRRRSDVRRLAHAEAAQLDRRLEPLDRLQRRLRGDRHPASSRTSTLRLISRAAATRTSAATKSAAAVGLLVARGHEGDRGARRRFRRDRRRSGARSRPARAAVPPSGAPGDVTARLASIASTSATANAHRRVDARRLVVEEVAKRGSPDQEAARDEQRGLGERAEMLRLRVPVRMTGVGRSHHAPTAKKVSSAAARSAPECSASERRPRLSVARLVASLTEPRARPRLDENERRSPLWAHAGRLCSGP